MTEHIKIESKDHILTLIFARPDKKNAITNAMYGVLADAILGAETDPATRVIVLRGEGDMFTAGNDVGEFAMMATGGVNSERHVSRFVEAIARSTKPLVAASEPAGIFVSRAATEAASACSLPSSTTRLAMPSCSAVFASMVSPSANIA